MVRAALETVMTGRTVIAIAHRVSSVQHADTIFVLALGRLVEQGTHHALMAMNGVYARQIAQQSSKAAGTAHLPR